MRPPSPSNAGSAHAPRPNLIVIYTDDHRADGLGFVNPLVRTPNIDQLAARGVHYPSAFVVSALCTPSRAQMLTGRYGSQNGVTELSWAKGNDFLEKDNPRSRLRPGETTVAHDLRAAGYFTGLVGKWHIADSPTECGFEFQRYFIGNGDYFDIPFLDQNGTSLPNPGHVEEANARHGVDFLRAAAGQDRPFFLYYNTRVPHMDDQFTWPVQDATRRLHPDESFPLPGSYHDTLADKPDFIARSRNRTQALKYGYEDPARVLEDHSLYYSAISELDATLGTVLDELERTGQADNTYIVLMGDNGWFLADHMLSSKVLAYEQAMRVPLIIAGPGIARGRSSQMALNIDLRPTLLEWAGVPCPSPVFGRSLAASARRPDAPSTRDAFLYEMPPSSTGGNPRIEALRTDRHKLIRTYADADEQRWSFVELYDISADPDELANLAASPEHASLLAQLHARLDREGQDVAAAR